MPGARLTLKIPAASAAPVPPAQTSACALPVATARAACTIEAEGVLRAAITGSAAFAIETGASTSSTPAGSSPSCAAGPNSSTRAPCSAASAAPAATSPGPRSAPLQSTATTARAPRSCSAPVTSAAPLLVLGLVVLVGVRGLLDDLAACVGAAHRAHAVRPARAVALRARVHGRRGEPVLRATLGGAAVRLLFLGYGHRAPKPTSSARAYSRRSSRNFDQRGSGAGSCTCSAPA